MATCERELEHCFMNAVIALAFQWHGRWSSDFEAPDAMKVLCKRVIRAIDNDLSENEFRNKREVMQN